MNRPIVVYCVGLFAAFILTAATSSADDPGGKAARELQVQLSLALQGNVDSQYRVGEIYEQGLGVRRDMALAYLWYNKAARQGDARARDRIAALDKTHDSDAKERERVNAAVHALQQQSDQETAAKQGAREKEKAAAEARARRQAEHEAAAEALAAKAKAKAETPATTPGSALTAPADLSLPVEAKTIGPAKPAAVSGSEKPKQPDNTGFSANPCEGPQARFRSICNM